MKRKSLDIQKEIYHIIKDNAGITMTELERKVGTNPASLREHCEHLQFFGLIKIEKSERTTILFIE